MADDGQQRKCGAAGAKPVSRCGAAADPGGDSGAGGVSVAGKVQLLRIRGFGGIVRQRMRVYDLQVFGAGSWWSRKRAERGLRRVQLLSGAGAVRITDKEESL